MKRHAKLAVLGRLVLASCLSASVNLACAAENYFECLIEELPGSETDTEALTATSRCREEFPENPPPAQTNADLGLFEPDNRWECIDKYATDTQSLYAANLMAEACAQLFPEELPPETPEQ